MARKQSRYGQPAVYNSTPPTLTDGDDSALNVDSAGRLLVSSASGSTAGSAAGTGVTINGGVYNATSPTYTDGNATQTQSDVNGNQKVTLATAIAGEDIPNDVLKVEQRFSAGYISTATTTTLKTGVGFLHTLTVQGGTAGTVIVYDNTAASGTILASFDSTNALATYAFDISFSVGLTIITSAATKLTASYR